MDCSPPSSSVHGIFQEEHWSGLPLPPPGDLSDPPASPVSTELQADSLLLSHQGSPDISLLLLSKWAWHYLACGCPAVGPFDRQGNEITISIFIHLPKATQPGSCQAGVWTQSVRHPEVCSWECWKTSLCFSKNEGPGEVTDWPLLP